MPFLRFLEKPNLELLGRSDPTVLNTVRGPWKMRVQLRGVRRACVSGICLCSERYHV